MKSEERRILLRKITIIIFLVMLVIGFTVPSLLDLGKNEEKAEQRLCNTDTDCYLMCADKPVTVICSQNLCWQNSCSEPSVYPFSENITTFTLKVRVKGEKLDLANRSQSKDLFVKFNPGFNSERIEMYSPLSLRLVLEKVKMTLTSQCLNADVSYCSGAQGQLTFNINGERSYLYESYVPQQNDVIEINFE